MPRRRCQLCHCSHCIHRLRLDTQQRCSSRSVGSSWLVRRNSSKLSQAPLGSDRPVKLPSAPGEPWRRRWTNGCRDQSVTPQHKIGGSSHGQSSSSSMMGRDEGLSPEACWAKGVATQTRGEERGGENWGEWGEWGERRGPDQRGNRFRMSRSQLESLLLILAGWHTAKQVGEVQSTTEATLTNCLSGRSSERAPEDTRGDERALEGTGRHERGHDRAGSAICQRPVSRCWERASDRARSADVSCVCGGRWVRWA